MDGWIDVTKGISRDMAVWPGNDPVSIVPTASYADGADSITSNMTINLHDGTHLDAPLHFIEGGASVDQLDVGVLNGPCVVVQLGDSVAADDLEAASIPTGTERVFLRTQNSSSDRLDNPEFDTSFVALTPDASQWVVDHGIKLIGIDYLSIALYNAPPETHRTLLAGGVLIIEGLHLDRVEPGAYDLMALPILIHGAEAAPVRAFLRATDI